jgi:hypothetical protein
MENEEGSTSSHFVGLTPYLSGFLGANLAETFGS